jgi:acyl transferase domain-containing protein
MVLLKRLEDAIRDNDGIVAVIRGSAVNQDGRSNGLTAPNGPAQQAAIREALADAGVTPREIGYVEAHGTGTPLGDPIEMNSLVAVLNEDRAAEDVCRVGSVKTNIGHLEAAAGIAGLIKTALVLQHREIPAQLHYRSLNPHIALGDTPFRIAEQTALWTAADGTRLAGVSSFGFGGTNAHAILGEAPLREAVIPACEQPLAIVAFSARTPEALRALARSYAGYIGEHPDVVLRDLVFSINTGRSHFAYRAVAEAFDPGALRLKLLAIADGGVAPPSHPLAVRYMNGDMVDWAELYTGGGCWKLVLPTYPFERRRCWIEDGAHPLLGRRLEEEAHQPSTWTWESSLDGPVVAFLSGHRMMGSAVLPWSAYAEMALSAAAQAGGEDVSAVTGLTLHHPLFLREREPRTIQTVLSRESAGRFSFAVYHRPGAPDSMPAQWQLCASATIRQRGAA